MATEPRNQSLTPRHFQVLNVLATAPLGCDVNALLTRGFKLETMADLVLSELATVRVETERGLKIEFAYLRITDAGWQALEGLTTQRRGATSATRAISGFSAQEQRRCGRRWPTAWGYQAAPHAAPALTLGPRR